jgi:ethanolamine utilization protein EutA
VILTGEALRRENAAAIAGIVAEKGGDFVCATAGHHMESMLAAYGSGAATVSSTEKKRILNIDIGGGTTKLAVVENGKATATAAVHVGGRLQVIEPVIEPGADGRGRILRLDPAGKTHARRAGFDWNRGDTIDLADLDAVAETMADTLVAALATRPLPHDVAHLYLTDPIEDFGAIDGMMFSGGVGEYIYRREDRDFGDMGRRLGHAIRRRIDAGALPWPLLPAGECIRATALGASEYSVQLSGNTSYISTPGALLPRRNLQVLQPAYVCTEAIDPDAVAAAITRHLVMFDVAEEREIALAFRWQGPPAYERLAGFAEGIRRGLAGRIARRQAIYVMLDGDVAQTLGAILREELYVASEILVIDGVVLMDFDYIDLGRIRLPSNTVPVTIKSLVFSEDTRGPRPTERLHHRADEHDHAHEHDDAHEHGHVHHHHQGHRHHEHQRDDAHGHGHVHVHEGAHDHAPRRSAS